MLCPADLTLSTHFLRFVQSCECEWIAVLRVTRGTHQFSLDFLSKWLEISLRAIAHGFESHPLRQKPSHIKAFAHMTGLFFSLKVTSAYMIFGKSSGVPAGLPCVRQGQDIVHHICRGDLGLVIQMAVNIRRRANIAVTQPLLDLLQRHIVRQKQ